MVLTTKLTSYFNIEMISPQTNVKDTVYACVYYFCELPTTAESEQIKRFAVGALGLLMIQDPDMMFRPSSRQLYRELLSVRQPSSYLKARVRITFYLQSCFYIEKIDFLCACLIWNGKLYFNTKKTRYLKTLVVLTLKSTFLFLFSINFFIICFSVIV